MLIILEGPDCAGKSTIIKKLQEQFTEAKVFHFGAPELGVDQYMRYMQPMLDHPHELLIYDRSWYSEYVYGPVMRNTLELTMSQVRMLEQTATATGGGIIMYLTAPVDVLWNRCQERGETYITNKGILAQIRKEYENVMKKIAQLPVFRIDTSR